MDFSRRYMWCFWYVEKMKIVLSLAPFSIVSERYSYVALLTIGIIKELFLALDTKVSLLRY